MAERGRPKAPLVLSEEERDTLFALGGRPRPNSLQALALRSKIVLACAEGKPNEVVATGLRCSKPTVGKFESASATQPREWRGPLPRGWIPIGARSVVHAPQFVEKEPLLCDGAPPRRCGRGGDRVVARAFERRDQDQDLPPRRHVHQGTGTCSNRPPECQAGTLPS